MLKCILILSVAISGWKRCSVRLCLRLFVDGSCLVFFICVCLRIVVSNTYCVVCLLSVVLLTVSLDCQYLVSPSVFSNFYLRVHTQPISSIYKHATELVGSTIISLIYRVTMVFKNQNVCRLRTSTS